MFPEKSQLADKKKQESNRFQKKNISQIFQRHKYEFNFSQTLKFKLFSRTFVKPANKTLRINIKKYSINFVIQIYINNQQILARN